MDPGLLLSFFRVRFSHVLFALLYFCIFFSFGSSIFGFRLWAAECEFFFETGALPISMRWRFLDAVNFYVPMMNCAHDRRPNRAGVGSGEHDSVGVGVGAELAKVFPALPRSRNHRTGNCHKFLMRFTMCVLGPLMISILFHVYSWALSVCIFICACFGSSHCQHSTWPKGYEFIRGICGSVLDSGYWILDSHPTHAKSVDHEMNGHKYNAEEPEEQDGRTDG